MTLEELVIASHDYSSKIRLQYPLTDESLERIKPSTKQIMISSHFSPDECKSVAAAMERTPNATLIQLGYVNNLDFLEYFPKLISLRLEGPYESLSQLKQLLYLKDLTIDIGKPGTVTLNDVAELKQLKRLALSGSAYKGVKAIRQLVASMKTLCHLPHLQVLAFNGLTLPDLEVIPHIPSLRSLTLSQCSIADLSAIGMSKTLLHLHMGNCLTQSLAFISPLSSLQWLSLSYLSKVDQLPSMSSLSCLRKLELDTLVNLKDFSPIYGCPALEDLVLTAPKNVEPDDLSFLRDIPTLKRAWIELGSRKRNVRVKDLLRLPSAGARSRFVFRI
ncbi:MAG: hypothetical protein IPL73_17390 [Candidatus Obscuribacter sp.]|nr:hypothetical protein [Candidatus Obscuribacter sp.]